MRRWLWLPFLFILGSYSGTTHTYCHTLSQVDKAILLAANDAETVDFNMNSHIYHNPHCSAALRCTHCIKISRAEAKQRGGRACKLCGGGEWN